LEISIYVPKSGRIVNFKKKMNLILFVLQLTAPHTPCWG